MQQRFFLLIMLIFSRGAEVYAQDKQPNVLFIFVDDLRPDLGCYGNSEIRTPHIDELANEAVLFKHQYVAVPTCGASRACILTGKYPRTAIQLKNEALEKTVSGKPRGVYPETFIEQFKRNGYYTVGIGKISHSADGYVYGYAEQPGNKLELPHSWDEMLFNAGKWGTGWNAFFAYQDGSNRTGQKGMVKPYESGNCEDEGYPDGLTSKLAVEKIKMLAGNKQPFFLGVGFFKPHLPFNAPKRYWDLYDEESIPLSPSPALPSGINAASLHPSAEFNQYKLGEERATLSGPVSDQYARKLRHAYYAGVSYIDAQVGKVLQALKESGLDKNTIVVLWGDHGWHLGDDLVWGKHTLFEWSLRSAFIIKTPAMNKGVVCNNIVSAVDVYPTLMELCGLEMPYGADGQSLLPLLTGKAPSSWRDAAFSYFRNGITIRTPRYRFTKYFRQETPTVELYDHTTDPYEQENIAAQQPAVVKQLLTNWEKEIAEARNIYEPVK